MPRAEWPMTIAAFRGLLVRAAESAAEERPGETERDYELRRCHFIGFVLSGLDSHEVNQRIHRLLYAEPAKLRTTVEVECPVCQGTGELDADAGEPGALMVPPDTCELCEGRGSIPPDTIPF